MQSRPANGWKWLRVLPSLGWMTLIFTMSNQPGGESGRLSKLIVVVLKSMYYDLQAILGESAFFWIRKFAHMTEYGILFLLLGLGISGFTGWKKAILPAAVIAILYAASDEFHQTWIPGRVGTAWDVLVDSLGVGIGVLFVFWVMKLGRK